MKKLLAFLLALAMSFTAVLFVGCGNDTQTGGGGTEQQQTDDDSKDTPGGDETPGGETKPDGDETSGGETNPGGDDNPGGETTPDDDSETVREELYIVSPKGETYLYSDSAKEYLLAGKGANIAGYAKYGMDAYKPTYIKWKNTYKNVTEYVVECSVNEDYSDAMSVTVDQKFSKAGFDNLYKGTQYYVRVTAKIEGGGEQVATGTFTTSSVGPRPLTVDGIHNVRDLGGYMTDTGKVTAQGKIYRGGSLSPSPDFDKHNLTEAGKKYMSEVLKIRLDMDLRGPEEGGSLAQSPIPNANMHCFNINGYASAFGQQRYKDRYKAVFQTLADENNYPIYMHCSAGADRTGTVSFLLNALLGVGEEDIIHDYEFTSFSIYGERNVQGGGIGEEYRQFRAKFDAQSGATMKEKAENYLLSIGIMQSEIDNIRLIMGV